MKYPIVDTHCHLDDERFLIYSSLNQILDNAFKSNIKIIMLPSTSESNWVLVENIACLESPCKIYSGFGIHPWFVFESEKHIIDVSLEKLYESWATKGQFIGECGLDIPFSKKNNTSIEYQEQVLEKHLQISKDLKKTIAIHCVKAHERLIPLLKKYHDKDMPVVLHSYSGSSEQLKEYLKLNTWFSFSSIITNPNAKKSIKALMETPLDRLLFESDAPSQIPFSIKDAKLNEPSYVNLTIDAAVDYLNIEKEKIIQYSTQNAFLAFKLV